MWGTMMTYQLTLDRILERAGTLFGNIEIASRRADGTMNRYCYADFHRRAAHLAAGLRASGLKRGERVATLMWNHSAHLESFFGVPGAGGVLHTLNHRLHPNDLSYIMNHADDRFLILDDLLLPVWEAVKGRVDCRNVIVVRHTQQSVADSYRDYEDVLARGASTAPSNISLHENEAAVLCYTTGTAGSPKGVLYSHRSIALHSLAISMPDAFGISRRDTIMPLVPMYHANAWGLPYAAIMSGSRLIFAGANCDTSCILDLATTERVTLSAGVPLIWADVMRALQSDPVHPRSDYRMRVVVSGAAPPEAIIRELDRYGIRVIQAWGLVESSPIATVSATAPSSSLPQDADYEIRASQGVPLPFVDIRAIGDSGSVPWDGLSLGEVQLRAPWVTASYYNLPDFRTKWTEDGWFRTGDVAKFNVHGYLKLTDRAKDLIRYGDDWISSVDIENELMGHPAVREAAVIAVSHPQFQERPLAAVVLKEGETATPEGLRQFLGTKFAPWQLPEAVVFVPSLPHTPTGKLLKKELRKQFKSWKWDDKTAP